MIFFLRQRYFQLLSIMSVQFLSSSMSLACSVCRICEAPCSTVLRGSCLLAFFVKAVSTGFVTTVHLALCSFPSPTHSLACTLSAPSVAAPLLVSYPDPARSVTVQTIFGRILGSQSESLAVMNIGGAVCCNLMFAAATLLLETLGKQEAELVEAPRS